MSDSSTSRNEPLLTRAQTVAKIAAEFDQRRWRTANDDHQLRLYSAYELEAVRAALESFQSEIPSAREQRLESALRVVEAVLKTRVRVIHRKSDGKPLVDIVQEALNG